MSGSEIGNRVRAYRERRGLSVRVCAELAGLSKSFLSDIENGRRRLERRSHISALAEVLRISVHELIGQQFPPDDPTSSAAHAAVADVRLALVGSDLEHTEHTSTRPVEELERLTDRVLDLRQACEYEEVGRLLPDLIRDLHAVAAGDGPDGQLALRKIVLVAQVAVLWLKNLNAADLAWIAADRGRQAALRVEDPLWSAVAAFSVAQGLLSLGANTGAAQIAEAASDSVPRDTEEGLQVYGMQCLTAAFSAVASGRRQDADTPLAEARRVASRTGDCNAFWLAFGPVNVDLWRLSIAVEAGEAGRAIEIGNGIDPRQIPVRSRRSSYHVDLGRALAQARRREDALRALLEAESLAPVRVRNNPFAREIVSDLLRRAQMSAGGAELRRMAHRMGVRNAIL
ncbi:MAG TPA: helix-turn-helix transcriptional regulator [Mycobacteriales bacterium]|nr:helix-turn-helix transcriptional regulator [Mycobacteriales bacterium]